MTESSDLRTRRILRDRGAGQMPALGFGTLIPDPHDFRHASFEPGQDWFYDYDKQGMIKGAELLPPHSHPEDPSAPGPEGKVPANGESLLDEHAPVDFS